jgi:hypothetical protein
MQADLFNEIVQNSKVGFFNEEGLATLSNLILQMT